MAIFHLAIMEIAHRKVSFLFAVLSIAVAVGSLTGTLTLLQGYDVQTQAILETKQADLEKRVTRINDDIRKAMQKLGFNIIILPKDQNLGDWYAQDYASKYMPLGYVDQLARSNIETLEHLVPCLRQRITWPETKWTILVVGTGDKIVDPQIQSGELPFEPIPKGRIILGHEIHRALGFKVGQTVTLMKHEFTVHKCHPEHGNKDDVTVWLDLLDAQELLDKKGLINEIHALEMQGAWSNISRVREEITHILPNAQVVEITSLASAKTAARTKALEEGKASIQRERESRETLQATQKRLACILVPLVLLICTGWLSLLSFRNVQDRRSEIGILMSLGYASGEILRLFLFRSLLLAFFGGFAGFFCGGLVGTLDSRLLVPALLVAGVITAVAVWGPAVRASQQDPADILRCD